MRGPGLTSPDKKAARYGFVFMMGGMLTLVEEWLKNGMDTPVPEMVKLLAKMAKDVMA